MRKYFTNMKQKAIEDLLEKAILGLIRDGVNTTPVRLNIEQRSRISEITRRVLYFAIRKQL